MDDFAARSTSRTYSIAELRSVVTSGQFRVPQFQRSFRWEAQDVLNLFDSILRGYPFGSLLLWQREADADDLRVVVLTDRHEGSSVIPLPDLFDFGRALEWLRKNPDASIYAELIQDVAGRLNRLAVPATVLEQADESTLREIFDRINSRGKRLNLA